MSATVLASSENRALMGSHEELISRSEEGKVCLSCNSYLNKPILEHKILDCPYTSMLRLTFLDDIKCCLESKKEIHKFYLEKKYCGCSASKIK